MIDTQNIKMKCVFFFFYNKWKKSILFWIQIKVMQINKVMFIPLSYLPKSRLNDFWDFMAKHTLAWLILDTYNQQII